jgi:hypothetical protein
MGLLSWLVRPPAAERPLVIPGAAGMGPTPIPSHPALAGAMEAARHAPWTMLAFLWGGRQELQEIGRAHV